MFNRSLNLGALVLSLALLAAGCSSTTTTASSSSERTPQVDNAAEEAAIQKLYADWRVAVEAGDIPSYLRVLHPDVRLFPPGADPIVGAAGYGEFLIPVFASATYRIDVPKMQVVQVMGDTAIAEYEYIINIQLKDPESAISQPGALTAARNRARYFDVLRKQPNGQWGVWRHLWQDQPLAPQ